MKTHVRIAPLLPALFIVAGLAGCSNSRKQSAGAPRQQMHAMPVQTITVAAQPVPESDQYVATIESRRSATISPQVSANITRIFVNAGDHVRAGQPLFQLDRSKQLATVQSQEATDRQLQSVYDYNKMEVERERKLFADGIISKDAMQQAEQAWGSARANYEAGKATLQTQQQELAYYTVTAPYAGILGDIPVHVGDYVTPSTQLTTVNTSQGLEAYIYVPTERAGELRNGLPVDIYSTGGALIQKTKIDFVSPQVDNALQSILVKAPVQSSQVRNDQLVNAQIIWGTSPHPVVPVLSVVRLGGQAFVYVAAPAGSRKFVAREQPITLGPAVGNNYAVLSGLSSGQMVIISGTQFLMDGMPVVPIPMHAGPPPAAAAHSGA